MYLVTNRVDKIPIDKQVILITDSILVGQSIKGLRLKPTDIWIDLATVELEDIDNSNVSSDWCYVTNKLTTDVIVTALWMLLDHNAVELDNINRLRAISYLSKYLILPPKLSSYRSFALKAILGLKNSGTGLKDKLGLPSDRKSWSVEETEAYESILFKERVVWMVQALTGNREWPGQSAQSDRDWETYIRRFSPS